MNQTSNNFGNKQSKKQLQVEKGISLQSLRGFQMESLRQSQNLNSSQPNQIYGGTSYSKPFKTSQSTSQSTSKPFLKQSIFGDTKSSFMNKHKKQKEIYDTAITQQTDSNFYSHNGPRSIPITPELYPKKKNSRRR